MAAGSKNMPITTKDTDRQNVLAEDNFNLPLPEKACRDHPYPYRHEWRIIENFHEELPRDLSKPRVYAAYCIYCLLSKGVEVKINK